MFQSFTQGEISACCTTVYRRLHNTQFFKAAVHCKNMQTGLAVWWISNRIDSFLIKSLFTFPSEVNCYSKLPCSVSPCRMWSEADSTPPRPSWASWASSTCGIECCGPWTSWVWPTARRTCRATWYLGSTRTWKCLAARAKQRWRSVKTALLIPKGSGAMRSSIDSKYSDCLLLESRPAGEGIVQHFYIFIHSDCSKTLCSSDSCWCVHSIRNLRTLQETIN